MSIEIINKGQTKFIMNCSYCDCKFSYEGEDIKTNLYPFVYCPNCGKICEHSDRERPSCKPINIYYGETSYNGSDDACVNCWFYRNVLKNNPGYVGDTPCDTCPNHQVTCVSNT